MSHTWRLCAQYGSTSDRIIQSRRRALPQHVARDTRRASLPARVEVSTADTRAVVVTSNRPAALRRSLPQIVALGVPVLVVDNGSRESARQANADACRAAGAIHLWLPEDRGLASAMNAGLSYVLADPGLLWISWFHDDVDVDPKTLARLRTIESPVRRPVLTGYDAADHVAETQSRIAGLTVKLKRSSPSVHLHGHVEYWKAAIPIPSAFVTGPPAGDASFQDDRVMAQAQSALARRGLLIACVPGLVTRFPRSLGNRRSRQAPRARRSPGESRAVRALTVRGPFRGLSGYDRHTRVFVGHLAALGVAIELIDVPEWTIRKLPEATRDPWFESLTRPVPAQATLHFCTPPQVKGWPDRLNVNYTMFEATRVPAAWMHHSLRHDLVIVPNETSRQAWLHSGLPSERIRIAPLGIDTDRFRPGLTPLSINDGRAGDVAQYRVRILNVSALSGRKNLVALLRAWIRATRPTDDALLIVKLDHHGSIDTIWFMRAVAEMEKRLGKMRSQAAPIVFVERALADEELPSLYAAGTHYWSMSRGEAWDQPMHEAAASGLQLIVPRHSAYAECLDDRVAWMTPARVVPAIADEGRGPQAYGGAHADWWEPDEDAAVDIVRHVVGHPEDLKPLVRPQLVARFSWPDAARRLLTLLEKLHAERALRF